MNVILKHKDINIKDISIKKQINVSNEFTNYPIKYNNSNLIIQTPIVFLPFGFNRFNNKSYIDFSFINCNNDNIMRTFKTKIINISNHLKNKFSSKRKFSSSFKSTEHYPDRLRLSFSDDILIFNEAKSLITHEYIKSKLYVKLLISPHFLWITHDTYGIMWSILQMEIYSKPLLETYSFIEEEVNIDKYIKMMRCGVPPPAIKNKMVLEKIDPCLLDTFLPKTSIEMEVKSKTKNTYTNTNTKNKLVKSINKKEEKESNGFRMTLDVLKNIKLKKVNETRVPPPFTHMNPFVNVDELQSIKRKIMNE